MKNNVVVRYSLKLVWSIIILVILPSSVIKGQAELQAEKDRRPVRSTFESIWLMNHQTVDVSIKGTFEMDFQHRFGTWDRGYDDFFGIFAPSNMRIGFDYVPFENLLIGFGLTKNDLLWDVHGKYALIRQGREAGWPISASYYVNVALDTRKEPRTNFDESTDRWSYFHQIMIAHKVTDALSVQVAGNLSWFNFKDPVFDVEGIHLGRDENSHFSAAAMARYKLTNTMGLTVAYEFPITDQRFTDPEPNLSLGIELVSSSHAFQIFIGNYDYLLPQYNSSFNDHSFGDNEILIGFNITRLWNF